MKLFLTAIEVTLLKMKPMHSKINNTFCLILIFRNKVISHYHILCFSNSNTQTNNWTLCAFICGIVRRIVLSVISVTDDFLIKINLATLFIFLLDTMSRFIDTVEVFCPKALILFSSKKFNDLYIAFQSISELGIFLSTGRT